MRNKELNRPCHPEILDNWKPRKKKRPRRPRSLTLKFEEMRQIRYFEEILP
jgi:hypothetical protein